MNNLVIKNKIIDAPILDILNRVKLEITNHKLATINPKHDYVLVTCPHHSGGHESHPSCGVYCGKDSNIIYGTCHCFTCGFKGSLSKFIGECFDSDFKFGEKWLLNNFGSTLNENKINLEPITLNKPKVRKLSETILDEMQSYHPYMTSRKLTPDVINKFKIKYDPKCKCIVFPVYDEYNNLVMLTKRHISTKKFYIEENVEKPIYLLNHVKNNNINSVYVCESQINALTCYVYGKPAIALFGTGSEEQYKILKRSNIKRYILAFDGDDAGYKGIIRFLKNMPRDVIIDILNIPKGKDINDLTLEEFEALDVVDSHMWLRDYKNNKEKIVCKKP